jgi:hypothetical protein
VRKSLIELSTKFWVIDARWNSIRAREGQQKDCSAGDAHRAVKAKRHHEQENVTANSFRRKSRGILCNPSYLLKKG